MRQRDSERKRGVGWVAAQGLLFVFFLTAIFFGEPVGEIPGLIFSQIIGLIVGVAGAAVSVWAFIQHGRSISPFPKPRDGAHLIDTGPYQYVRHPMYSGIILFTLGAGLAYANPVAVLSSVTFLVFFMAKTGREEEMLVDTVEGYRAYRSRVPWSLIPFFV